jgi:FKBP-type peptidyl-prolyl cis-trans isomerase FkpA
MKKLASVCAIAAALSLTACGKDESTKAEAAPAAAVTTLQTDIQKQSYGLGMSIATNISKHIEQSQEMGIALDLELMKAGFVETLAGQSQLKAEELEPLLTSLQANQRTAHEAKMKADEETNKAAGAKFLEENKTKEGVITTESGLQYQVIQAAEGAKPAAEDTVTVHYTGTLIDGTKFDSSVDRGEPTSFPLNRVIPGWTEGVQLMTVGSKYRFYIPFDLAYGPRGTGSIPPFATLIFDVELISIEGKDETAAAK